MCVLVLIPTPRTLHLDGIRPEEVEPETWGARGFPHGWRLRV